LKFVKLSNVIFSPPTRVWHCRRVPAFPHEKKLSRIQTLRLAIRYIMFMSQLVDVTSPPPPSCQFVTSPDVTSSSHMTSWHPFNAPAPPCLQGELYFSVWIGLGLPVRFFLKSRSMERIFGWYLN